jgi:hypothetical protein
MNAHITQSLQLKRAKRAAFAPFVMPLRLPSFSQVPGALMLCTLLGALAVPNIAAAGFVFDVNDMRDVSDGSLGDSLCNTVEKTCTLRAAIEEISASTLEGSNCGVFDFANRVILPPGTYKLAPKSSSLGIGRDDRDVCVHIAGTGDNEGPAATVINGNATEGKEGTEEDLASSRVFSIHPRGRMSLDGVTITQGHIHFVGGGAILNEGDLAIYNSLLTKNSTHGRGGAIQNEGNLWINESTLSFNWSKPNTTYYKDGKYKPDLDGDGVPDEIAGGAIANFGGSVLMYNVTVSGNLGGLDAKGQATDKGSAGGGIINVAGGVIGMNNSTVVHNRTRALSGANNGGGIYNDKISYANLWNTIVAENFFGESSDRSDCKGIFGSFGYNIVGNQGINCTVNRGPGDQVGGRYYKDPDTGKEDYLRPIDPKLGFLSQNGGPTPTHALLDGSPAIDAGNPDPAGNGACAEYDQRYLPRPKDGPTKNGYDGLAVCDIGAYEHGTPEISVGDVTVTEGNSGSKNMVFEVRLSYPSIEPINVFYWTVDGSAKAGSDYQAASGYLLFNPTDNSKPVNVKVVGDRTKEPDETLVFRINPDALVRIKKDRATGTIKSDD